MQDSFAGDAGEVIPAERSTRQEWPFPMSDVPALLQAKAAPTPDATGEIDILLVTILSWKRRYDTVAEMAFNKWIVNQLAGFGQTVAGGTVRVGAGGCIICTVTGDAGVMSNVLFSCHTDTTESGNDPAPQRLAYDPGFGHIIIDKTADHAGNSLGADDGAGVWVMLKMIEAKKPGTYVFHRGEERGGIGAWQMHSQETQWLSGFKQAIAFDRPGDFEVIITQGGNECASVEYGKALCEKLNEHGFQYETSTKGLFTDTKVYRDLIPECINIGVGYLHHHSADECLDYHHLSKLKDAAIAIDWDALPVTRDPKKASSYPTYSGNRSWTGNGWRSKHSSGWDDDWKSAPKPPQQGKWAFPQGGQKQHQFGKKSKKGSQATPDLRPHEELDGMHYTDVVEFCQSHPLSAAILLMELAAEVYASEGRMDRLKQFLIKAVAK